MKVAITGATGFIGHYLVQKMQAVGNDCRCWYRSEHRCFDTPAATRLEWVPGELGDEQACERLLAGCDAVIHSGLHRSGSTFRGGEGDMQEFVRRNVLGTVQLIETARRLNVSRFVYISTCAVHEKILDDRPLDEAHPLWMTTHYGAHKAAVEQFVHSYGFGVGYDICALRPPGVYGLHHEPVHSRWFDLVKQVVAGETVDCQRGAKLVHAADVAEAADLLLHADDIAGEAFSCYDRYVSDLDVAELARQISGSSAVIHGERPSPSHEIVSDKIRTLGMQFGGEQKLRETVAQLVEAAQNPSG